MECQALSLPSFVGTDVLVVPPIGQEGVIGDRFYDDGYVRVEPSTPFDGLTSYWGYQNDAQVAGDTLLYHSTGLQSIRSDRMVTDPGASGRDSLRDMGIEIRADVLTPWRLGPFRVGGVLGLGIVAADQSYVFSNHRTTQVRDDYRLEYIDTYELGGVLPPGAGYEGSPTGGTALIPNVPAGRSLTPVPLFTDSAVLANVVRASFRDEVVGITAGASLVYQRGPWQVMVAGGIILEFHHYTTRQYETLGVAGATANGVHARWAEGESGTKLRPGLFAALHMPLARLAQYQHCLLRRNGVRTDWSSSAAGIPALREQIERLRGRWALADPPI